MELPAHHPFRSAKAQERYLALYDTRAKRWPVASQIEMLETAHGQTFVRISGAADTPPLVLLPGAAASSLMWMPNVAALSASYRTYPKPSRRMSTDATLARSDPGSVWRCEKLTSVNSAKRSTKRF